MRHFLGACMVLFAFHLQSFAQRISIGRSVPDLELQNVINHSSSSLRLEDYRGKLIILDFWGLRCLNCISAFPKMNDLQQKFKDRIQIIFVNQESKEETETFFRKRKQYIKIPPMPFITGDSVLNSFFPNKGVPFHVWIDSLGVVRYFTYGNSTTSENLSKYLNGDEVNFAEYNMGSFYEPLFSEKWEKYIEYSSSITNARNDVRISFNIDTNKYTRLMSTRSSVINLYQVAFNERGKYRYDKAGRTIIELTDQSRYTKPIDPKGFDEWKSNYTYNYQLIIPKDNQPYIFEMMKADLQRFFNLDVKIEKRKVACLVLEDYQDNNLFISKGGYKSSKFYKSDVKRIGNDSIRYFRNYPFSEFVTRFSSLMEFFFDMPFINEMSFDGNIDLFINGRDIDSGNLDRIQSALKKQGLNLVVSERLIDVLVIKDPPKNLYSSKKGEN